MLKHFNIALEQIIKVIMTLQRYKEKGLSQLPSLRLQIVKVIKFYGELEQSNHFIKCSNIYNDGM